MSTFTFARLVDRSGRIAMPPAPAVQLLENGKPAGGTYTLDQLEDLALDQIRSNLQSSHVEMAAAERSERRS